MVMTSTECHVYTVVTFMSRCACVYVYSCHLCVCYVRERAACGEFRRINRGPGELQETCNQNGLNYSILRGEGFNRCLIRCSSVGSGFSFGVATLRCDTPPFIRRYLKPDNPERSASFCPLETEYSCFAYGSGADCTIDPYLGLLG